MRELSLLETGYLAGLLLLSLALSLLMSFRSPKHDARRRSSVMAVWLGQTLGALAATVVLVSAPFAPYAAALGLATYIACMIALFQQFRAMRTA